MVEAGHLTDRVMLARERAFRLGGLCIDPATRQVSGPAGQWTLEPRVMQMLVALYRRRDEVVDREALLERCWGGVIVGDNAINRVVSRLRRLAADTGAFTIETIPRVGYRLTESGGSAASGPSAPPPDLVPDAPEVGAIPPAVTPRAGDVPMPRTDRLDRRLLLAGGGVALLLGGLAAFGGGPRLRASARVDALRTEAAILADNGLPGATLQARALLEEAVALAPDSADAWGALAIAHVDRMGWNNAAEVSGAVARADAAARRALALAPGHADASAALVLKNGFWRRWAAYEADCRSLLDGHPGHQRTRFALAELLCQVGRWGNALALLDPLAAERPAAAWVALLRAEALAGAGRLPEADVAFAEGARRWPLHTGFWSSRFEYLLLSGRSGQARATATDKAQFQIDHAPLPKDLGLMVAAALETQEPADRAAAVAAVFQARDDGRVASLSALSMLEALGDRDGALALLDLYLFGGTTRGGRLVAAPRQPSIRRTAPLFLPPLDALRTDPRFGERMNRVGLAAYWLKTGTAPQTRA
jgi:DNA-binding winged helix-turn-helix (wHTH) protein